MKKNADFIEVSYESIDSVIQELLLPRLDAVSVITFEGTLGSGKTTFIKRLIKLLGSDEVVTSPTFNYVNSYLTKGTLIQHFDLYRLEGVFDIEELGFGELIGALGTLSLIEWPNAADSYIQKIKNEGTVIEICFEYNPFDFKSRFVRIL
jgi:tRNA threonylcarbamoyladenosine biosynthesis protein TsaE